MGRVNLPSLSARDATTERWLCGDSQAPELQVQGAKLSGTPSYYKDSGVTARFRDSKADCISVFQVESY
jgi:hypothetical protein